MQRSAFVSFANVRMRIWSLHQTIVGAKLVDKVASPGFGAGRETV